MGRLLHVDVGERPQQVRRAFRARRIDAHERPQRIGAEFDIAALLFWRVRIHFTTDRVTRWMPYLVAALLTAGFLWIAENIGTWTGTWLYPSQRVWHWVSLGELGSWYLLLVISFVIVTLVDPPRRPDRRDGIDGGTNSSTQSRRQTFDAG